MTTRRVLSSLALFALSGCTSIRPIGLYDTSRPIVEPYDVGRYVEVELCRPYLFGYLPLSRQYRLRDLFKKAGDPRLALVHITLETRTTWWLLGTTGCTVLSGYQVESRRASVAAVEERAAPTAGTQVEYSSGAQERKTMDKRALPAHARDTSDETGAVTRYLYFCINQEVPAEQNFKKDVEVVRQYMKRGQDVGTLKEMAERGAHIVGSDKRLSEILQAGAGK